MASDLVFYTHPMSRGRIVRWMLEEVGEPYETVILDYGASMKTADYLAINPMGKVPALKAGDSVITECAAICLWLADRYPAAGLAPGLDEAARADFLRWMFYAAGPVEQAVITRQLGAAPTPRQEGMVGFGTFGRVMDTLEGLVSKRGPYLLGERFSALDVYLGSQIGWGVHFGSMEKRPGFEEYVRFVYDRPAHRRAEEIDDALAVQHPLPGQG